MKKVHLLALVASFFFLSCGDSQTNQITHIPFQMEKEGRWGLIDMEGNSLIEDEFKNEPSTVINGMFCVKNSDGLYEFYTAEKDFKQIGEEYLEVGYFSEGLAPVVKKDSRINYINKKGKVVFELTKYKDDAIESASSFENGIAIVRTTSGKEGCINTKGEFVIPPTYSSIEYAGEGILCITNDKNKKGYIDYKGKVLVEPKYTSAYSFNENGYAAVEKENRVFIIDKKGNEILKLKEGMNIHISWEDENLIPYSIENESCGYINLKGEKVIKLSSNIKRTNSFFNEYATFINNDWDYGIINKKGETVIRAKYDNLNMYDDFLLYEDDDEWGFLDYSGEVIKRACYKEVVPFGEGYNSTFAKDGDEWILIDKKGEEIKKENMPDIYDFCHVYYGNGYSNRVNSDYLDVFAEVKKIMSILNDDGTIDKMTFNMTPGEFVNVYNKDYQVNDLQGKTYIPTFITPLKYTKERFIAIKYDREIIKANYKREWVSNRWGGYYDDIIEGYSYNNLAIIEDLRYFPELKGKLAEKKKETLEATWNYLRSRGYIEIGRWEENDSDYETVRYEKDSHNLQVSLENNGMLQIWTWRK